MQTVAGTAYGTLLKSVALIAARAVSFGARLRVSSRWSVACYLAYACRWLEESLLEGC